MRIVYSGICDIGLKRENNQDSIFTYSGKDKDVSLFVVADGMGGYSSGELASQMITNKLSQWVEHFSIELYDGNFLKMMESLEHKLEEINSEIFFRYNQEQICGSTCILLFIYKEYYGIINIGDSRIYKKEGWKIKSLMKDDVWENSPDIQERFSKREIINHPNYGKLLQSVGTKENLALASKTDILRQGDTFLLCSDGLYKMCSEKKLAGMLQFVSESKVEKCVKKMLSACYKAGAGDNVSIIVVKCV
ncbi:MAG: serine/threonine-protein phosphatase [Lachnospiraceae bacterium]|nr:serine/threonine-protein phosphatase [Lachnospiraceae bacterium]